jgi:hypothetical protein
MAAAGEKPMAVDRASVGEDREIIGQRVAAQIDSLTDQIVPFISENAGSYM